MQNIKVLIVDDYSTMRRIVRNLLMQIGYSDLEEASDGSHALQKLRESNYRLILADWAMEPMSGLQLLKEVRGDAKLCNLPFIMIVPESKAEYITAAKEAGVNNYLVKPFNADTLKQKIQAVLGN